MSPQRRQWLHDLEHEAAALALQQERSRSPGKLSVQDRKELVEWSADFRSRMSDIYAERRRLDVI